MAFGLHREWRGFGAVSANFVNQYSKLKPLFGLQEIDDLYVYVPNLKINVKFREGTKTEDD